MALKVTFYPLTKTIKFKTGVRDVDIKIDVYSDGKEDWIADASLRKFSFPISTIGGNVRSDGKVLEPSFFLLDGWQLEPATEDHEVTIFGNISHDEGLPVVKVPAGQSIVVNLSTTISPDFRNSSVVQQASESALYNEKVYVDVLNGEPGVSIPIGTLSRPVNNIPDAVAIADNHGFSTLSIIGDVDFDTGDDVTGMIILGQSRTLSTFTINTGSLTSDAQFERATITGILDGDNTFFDATVLDITYVNGVIENCLIGPGSIFMAGGSDLHLLDCKSGVIGTGTPTVDMGGSGQGLGVRAYTGGIKISNKTGSESVSIDLISGQAIVDSTVTAGTVLIRGTGNHTDNSTGSTVVNIDGLLNRETITTTSWDAIHIDTISGVSGTDFPIGTSPHPVNNESDAYIIATRINAKKYFLKGNITLARNYANWEFMGIGAQQNNVITGGGFDTSGCDYDNLKLTGVITGSTMQYRNMFCENLSGMNGTVFFSGQGGTITMGDPGSIIAGKGGWTSLPTVLDMVGGFRFVVTYVFGNVEIRNLVDDSFCQIDIESGSVALHSSCTGGTAIIGGNGFLTDNSNGTAVVDNTYNVTIPKAVWDEPLTGATHNLPTSAGRKLRTLASAVIRNENAQGAGINGNQIILDTDASILDGAYDPALISIIDGTGAGQSRLIIEYEGSTKTATVDRNWKVNPDVTSEFVISANAGREHVNEGLAQGGTIATITLNALASSVDNIYISQTVFIRSGTGEDQVRVISSYNGTTKVATLTENWVVIPDSTTGYIMLPTHIHEPSEIVDAVWNAPTSDHKVPKTMGDKVRKIKGNKV